MTSNHKIIIQKDNAIYLQNFLGKTLPITSPWSSADTPLSIDRLLPGNCIYFGASLSERPEFIQLHFLPLSDGRAANFISWNVSIETSTYIDQELKDFDVGHSSLINLAPLHRTNSTIFSKLAKPYLNDLVIYQFIKYVLSEPDSASNYINQYAPDSESLQTSALKASATKASSTHIIVIYNHNYSRNIPGIENLYRNRFASVHHVLPNICPNHKRCFSLPAGSFQYHYLIYHGLSKIQADARLKNSDDWVIIVQDDVMLHPKFNEDSFFHFIKDNDVAVAFPHNLAANHDPTDSWMWNKRISNSCLSQSDVLYGNGFEGLTGFYKPEFLARGVSDIFAIRTSLIHDFLEILGFYISQNVFPEASIPTSLKALCKIEKKGVFILPGIYLWEDSRNLIKSPVWMAKNFYNSNNIFLHPVKASQQVKEYTINSAEGHKS
jgi:hypothetical protein